MRLYLLLERPQEQPGDTTEASPQTLAQTGFARTTA